MAISTRPRTIFAQYDNRYFSSVVFSISFRRFSTHGRPSSFYLRSHYFGRFFKLRRDAYFDDFNMLFVDDIGHCRRDRPACRQGPRRFRRMACRDEPQDYFDIFLDFPSKLYLHQDDTMLPPLSTNT